MYAPKAWVSLADNLAAALAGNGAPILNSVRPRVDLSDETSPQATMSAGAAVQCVDGPPMRGKYTREQAVDKILEAAVELQKVSPLMGSTGIWLPCFTWEAREVERYTGPWNTTGLASTVLIIANTADVRAWHYGHWLNAYISSCSLFRLSTADAS